MNRWKGKTIITFSILAFLLVLGCASTQVKPGADVEIWEGVVTGMADGDIKFSIVRITGENNVFSVKGNMAMKVKGTGGYGEGEVNCTIKGKIKNEVMNATIHGMAVVTMGSSDVSGILVGTMSKTQSFGTWSLKHVEGALSGEWTAEKKSTSQ